MSMRKSAVLSLIGAVCTYLLIRWPLFALHGMKEYPLTLLVITVLMILYGIYRKSRYIPVCAFLGYLLGFFIGLLLHRVTYDAGGGAMSDLWKIWGSVCLLGLAAGSLLELKKTLKDGQ